MKQFSSGPQGSVQNGKRTWIIIKSVEEWRRCTDVRLKTLYVVSRRGCILFFFFLHFLSLISQQYQQQQISWTKPVIRQINGFDFSLFLSLLPAADNRLLYLSFSASLPTSCMQRSFFFPSHLALQDNVQAFLLGFSIWLSVIIMVKFIQILGSAYQLLGSWVC